MKPEWVVTWGSQWEDEAWDVIEVGGYLYVTGAVSTSPADMDLFLRKYGLEGHMLWSTTWDNGDLDAGLVLVSDGSHLYLGGRTKVSGKSHGLLQKRNMDGTLVWSRTWIQSTYTEVDGIAVIAGDIYCTWWDASALLVNINSKLTKYDADGILQWTQTWGTELSKQDHPDGHIYTDGSSIWTTGRLDGNFPNSGGSAQLTKYDITGAQQYISKWGGSGFDDGLDLCSDGNNLYISGWTDSHGAGGYDSITLKYDMGGTLLSYQTWGGASSERSRGIELDGADLYVSAYTKSFGSGQGDTVLLHYRASDLALLHESIWGSASDDNVNLGLAMDEAYLYTVGKTNGQGAAGYDACMIKVARP